MFDLANQDTVDTIPEWLNDIKSNAPNAIIILVGTKSDLVD